MNTTTKDAEITRLQTLRRDLRGEAIRTPDAVSRKYRMDEVARITRKLSRMMD